MKFSIVCFGYEFIPRRCGREIKTPPFLASDFWLSCNVSFLLIIILHFPYVFVKPVCMFSVKIYYIYKTARYNFKYLEAYLYKRYKSSLSPEVCIDKEFCMEYHVYVTFH